MADAAIKCKIGYRRDIGVKEGRMHTTSYECLKGKEKGTVLIYWIKKRRVKVCILNNILVYPASARRHGFGTQALYAELRRMSKQCDEIEGDAMESAKGYWDKFSPEYEPPRSSRMFTKGRLKLR